MGLAALFFEKSIKMSKHLDILSLGCIIKCKEILTSKADSTYHTGVKDMRKMDEMDRNIQLRSIELGYKAVMLSLGVWTLFSSYQTLVNGAKHEVLPCLILCLAACIQSFSQIAMKQKMVAGDEEYNEPNRLVQTVIAGVVAAAVILSIGTYFILKA